MGNGGARILTLRGEIVKYFFGEKMLRSSKCIYINDIATHCSLFVFFVDCYH